MLRRVMLAAGGGATDPYWANVSSLLHFDGADGSTTFTDQTGKTWTANGSAQIDTAQSKFGGASLLGYNGSAYSQVETNSHTDFDFGTDDFTVEWWQRWNSMSTPLYQCAFQRGYNTAGALTVVTGNSDGKYLVIFNNNVVICAESTAGTTGSWVHYALTRSGTTVTLWRHGVASATGTSATNLTISKKLAVGGYATDSGADGQAFNGHIDEFRITRGIARYTANFTPPSAPFPDS